MRTQPTISRRPAAPKHNLPSDMHPVLQRVLAARGARSVADLDTSLKGLHPVQQLSGISVATDLLEDAVTSQARILVIADFDADGATSCAVALRALKAMGAQDVGYLVPNRFEFGYGLTPEIVDLAKGLSPDLIITVDNGISSIDGVDAAVAAGISVLITDHHLPAARLPAADAIVNPNLSGDKFPSKFLAGVGVIFYVMSALRARLREVGWFTEIGIEEPKLATLLDLVALGTVADVVPLDQNNRRFVAQGLARIRAGKCVPGIAALLAVAGRDRRRVAPADLGFAVGPRLNAAGRLADMSLGIECLLSDDPAACRDYAAELDRLNQERRGIEAEMRDQAVEIVESITMTELPAGICLLDAEWHQGVIGIVASRIKDRYFRPVIAFAPAGEDELKGSARSIPGLHIRDVLDTIAARNPGLITRFGGHAMAAGLSLSRSTFEEFSRAFDQAVQDAMGTEKFNENMLTDGELAAEDFDLDFARLLRTAAPWGQQFPEPTFDGEFDIQDRRIVGTAHVKLNLIPAGGGKSLPAIAFNAAEEDWASDAARIHAVYRLDVNEYRGIESLQLMIEYAIAV